MPKMPELQPKTPSATEQPSVTEVLRKAGLDPAKLNPIEREYFEASLSRQMPVWKREGKPVELEAVRWLEAQLAQKRDYLKARNISPAESRIAEADLRRAHERVRALENAESVARRDDPKFQPFGMMKRQRDALERMGVKNPFESTWEQRRLASLKAMYPNPFESTEGKNVEMIVQQRREADLALRKPMPSFRTREEREALAQAARSGPRKANPFLDESRIKEMREVQAQMLANDRYREALEDQNSRFATNRKTPADMIKDAIAKARDPKADIGPASGLYAHAVREYSSMLEIYSKDRDLGSDPKERIFAGLVSEERAIRTAMAERLSKRLVAQQKARLREPEDAIVHNYEFTVAGFGSEEKSTTYGFSTTNAIDTRQFRHALDVSSPEEARRNLAALGVSGLSNKAIAEMREGIQDPIAQTQLAEIKARKGTKG